MIRKLVAAVVGLVTGALVTTAATAVEYHCSVTRKFNSEIQHSSEHLDRYKPSEKIEDNGETAALSRCSFAPSEGRVTCDRYEVDKVVFDSNVKIKKYYYFHGQFDVQLYPSLSFVENNGRGDIAYGECRVVSP